MTVPFSPRYRTELFTSLIVVLLLCVSTTAIAENTKSPGNQKPAAEANGLQRRIDFGNSYILGQSIKSGAVYLLHRKKSDIKSMLHYREDYRDEILESFQIDSGTGEEQFDSSGLVIEGIEPKKEKMVRQ